MKVMQGTVAVDPALGISIEMSGDEVALSIDTYLVAHGIHVSGPRTITVNGSLCEEGHVYVDPSGFVIASGERISGGRMR